MTVQADPLAGVQDIHAIKRLIGILESHGMPATWAVADPTHSAVTPLMRQSAVEHELALLGDTKWLAASAGRARFARELTRRLSQARAAGVQVTTLVSRAPALGLHIDLLVKHQITAVSAIPADVRRPSQAPYSLHYGVWHFPTSGGLPTRSTWISNGAWSTWRRIRRSAREAATYHLLIDMPAICRAGRRGETTFGWLVQRVAELRDQRLLRVETLASAAARSASVPAAVPQQSILRRAA